MIELILLLTIICSAIMDAITSQDSFAKYGLWFSREGYVLKYDLEAWLNKFLPSFLSKFLAFDVFVVGTDLWHLSKTIMIFSFMVLIFGFTFKAFLAYFVWGLVFSAIYYIIR